ncbi:hypothetical protein BGW80DRAFT_172610 [Lactifluus volemus]|nr:hypothetical protein BGW80DRAFT_172610 [Lactifluus volemus]
MSGKAPPTGPRALLHSINGAPTKRHQQPTDLYSSTHPPPPSTSSTSSPSSSSPTSLINRIGALPPTGPRSLVNGNTPSKTTTKPTLNGHTNNLLTAQSRQPPTGPSALQQKQAHKGKQVEIKWSEQAIASTVSLFPRHFLHVLPISHLLSLSNSPEAQPLNLVPPPVQHVQHRWLLRVSTEGLLQAGHPAFRRSPSRRLSLLGLQLPPTQIANPNLLSPLQNLHLHPHHP